MKRIVQQNHFGLFTVYQGPRWVGIIELKKCQKISWHSHFTKFKKLFAMSMKVNNNIPENTNQISQIYLQTCKRMQNTFVNKETQDRITIMKRLRVDHLVTLSLFKLALIQQSLLIHGQNSLRFIGGANILYTVQHSWLYPIEGCQSQHDPGRMLQCICTYE